MRTVIESEAVELNTPLTPAQVVEAVKLYEQLQKAGGLDRLVIEYNYYVAVQKWRQEKTSWILVIKSPTEYLKEATNE
jgi:hypothetical protein